MFSSPKLNPLLGLVVAGAMLCPSLPLRAEEPTVTTLKMEDAKRTLELYAGSAFAVRLPAQLGTGYAWHLTPLNSSVVVQQGEAKTVPDAGPPNAGATEDQIFQFTAGIPGEVDLKFAYFRSFEKDKQPLRTVTFHISVLEAKK